VVLNRDAAYAAFLRECPEYASTAHLDALRATEYARLDAGGHAYLDYTGAGVYAVSQVREHAAVLESGVFGNPHSASPASEASTALVERARRAVRDWFGAGEDYVVVFTQNATT
jgi:selenocysteine lyase/cysteine desulfurase